MDRKFTWAAYPDTDAEFERLMTAIDAELTARGRRPFQRPIQIGRLLWEAFGWEGPAFVPRELADLPGFKSDVLMAKAQRWYVEIYGDQLKHDFAYGFVPVKLANAVWRVRAGVTYGVVSLFIDRNLSNRGVTVSMHGREARYNVLCAIEKLPQGLADKLSDTTLREHMEFHVFIHENLQWRSELPRTELLEMAGADYDSSTADVLALRYGQARWGAQQAVEKTLKGLLALARTPFPTGGHNGHNLKHLGEIFQQSHEISISSDLLSLASCSPKVRYGEEASTEQQAIGANHAVLRVLHQLRGSSKAQLLFENKE